LEDDAALYVRCTEGVLGGIGTDEKNSRCGIGLIFGDEAARGVRYMYLKKIKDNTNKNFNVLVCVFQILREMARYSA
jgi:hypothetical protein